jgi:glyoxylase-like metal-dependent hydrolase (beta-lactamase superfamily II)
LPFAFVSTRMSEYPQASGDVVVEAVSPAELAATLRAGDSVSVLDVRNRAEADAWPLSGDSVTTLHIPYYRFVEATVTDGVDALARDVRDALDEPVLVVCGRGEASAFVAEKLVDVGVDAANLAEGMRGWARVYHAVELDPVENATVIQYQRPSSGCLAYLVVSGTEALVVDPLRAVSERYIQDAHDRGAELVAAVDTHVHADHVSGVRALRARDDVEVLLPAGARDRGLDFDASLLHPNDSLSVGDVTLDVVALPGHTSEHIGLRLGDLLFSGDTVFLESVARPDLEDGDEGASAAARRLYDTLHGIDDDTVVAPAHFSTARPDESGAYRARMGDLRGRLSALSLDREAFVDRVTGTMPPRPANYEEIIAVNLGLDSATDEESFELELGPNNCAASAADAD